jgi:hypothetical protein
MWRLDAVAGAFKKEVLDTKKMVDEAARSSELLCNHPRYF